MTLRKDAEDIRPGFNLNARNLRDVLRGITTVVAGGPGIVTGERFNRVTVSATENGPRPITQQIWAQISSSTQDGTNRRWFYDWDQTVPTNTDTWEVMSAGLNSSSGYGRARNLLEANNGSSGMTGSGINLDTLPDGFDMVPIGIGAVVPMWFPTLKSGSSRFPVFSATNQVDGVCSLDAGAYPSRTITVDTVLSLDDTIVEVDASAGDVRVELPLASSVPAGAKLVTVKKVDSTTSVVTVVGNAADVGGIDGLTAYDLTFDGDAVSLLSSSSSWIIQ